MSAVSVREHLEIQSVLVALDAQGTNENALRAGAWLTEHVHGRMSVVHAVGSAHADWTWLDDPRATSKAEGLIERAWRSAVRQTSSVIGAKLPGGVRVEDAVHVRAGRPAEVVLDEAHRQDADVIVLGYQLDRPLLDIGSTARRVIAGAPRAVWVQKHVPAPIERLLVPVDLSKDSLLALGTACVLARTIGAKVEALHAFSSSAYVVSTWPDYPDLGSIVALDELRAGDHAEFDACMDAFDWRGVEHTTRFVESDPTQAVLDAEGRADLIVLGTHGRSRIASALLGSVTWSVLRRARLPVLAIRHPERELDAA
ncbi:MAG: universal stress protein [Planctomycetes bacterium]|nr:universal stress protein [Planctomycetota bacterium]